MKRTHKPSRVPALNNTYSGAVGELAVATILLRCGHKVAKPFWNNDAMDLVVLHRCKDGTNHLVIPVQVKSVQRLQSLNKEIPISGLKKKYLDRIPGLCLAIYSPEFNRMWFIPGADKIRELHAAGVQKSIAHRGKNRESYESIHPGSDVPIYVNIEETGPSALNRWLVDPYRPGEKIDSLLRELGIRLEPDLEVQAAVEASFDLEDDDPLGDRESDPEAHS